MNNLFHQVQQGENNQISFSDLRHVVVGKNVVIRHSILHGTSETPLVIGDNVTIESSQIHSHSDQKSFQFAGWKIQSQPTRIGNHCHLTQAYVENSVLEENCTGKKCSIRHSYLGKQTEIRPHGSVLLSFVRKASLGSEVSKCILEGSGFVSEHTASYLSLVAPSSFPILDASGKEKILTDLPNLTNIGAGTVFANYSGKPIPAPSLEQSDGSLKGTSILWGTFTAVNSVIVNRYGQPDAQQSLFDLLRNPDITQLGFASFVEKKVTGRVPAFSYSGDPSARKIKIGWVLEEHPGILLNILKKMKKEAKDKAFLFQDLVEGTLRLEIKLLQEEQKRNDSHFSNEQIEKGLHCLQQNLDGRWKLDEKGSLVTPWATNSFGKWIPSTQ